MPQKRYRQLKLDMKSYQNHYGGIPLSFKLNRKTVDGILHGDEHHWYFQSYSGYFLQIVPNGILHKYALWIDTVPKEISLLYNSIIEAALKAGYDLAEKEELQAS